MSGSNALLDAIAHPAQVNLLADYQGASQAARGIWANREMQSKQAIGQNVQSATNPDGSIDNAKLNLLNAQTPSAALGAQESATTNQNLQTAQTGFNQQQQAQIGKSLAGVLSQPDAQQTPANYKAALDFSLANHGITQDHYAAATQALAAAGDDPAALRQFGTRIFAGTLAGPQVAQYVMPTTGGIDQGPRYQPTVVTPGSQGGGQTPAGPAITVGLPTAAQKIAPVTGPATATGAPTTTTLGHSLTLQGLDGNGDPIANPAFAGLPASLRGPNQAATAAPVTPIATGVGPAATNAMAATGTSSSGAYQSITDAGTKAIGQRALLQSMAADASQFTTGPGASTLKNVKATIQRVGGIFGLSPIDADKLAANEDLDKVAAQLADAQGAGSDARLAVNQGANPSSHNTPAGLSLILGKLTGNADYLQARSQLAAKYQQTQDPQSANNRQFEATVGAQLDPRTFQFNRLNQDQQKQYLSELPDQKARDAFKMNFIKTKTQGLLPGG